MNDLTGRFVWRDLQSPDPEKSEAFYTGLFGWDVDPQDMGPAGVHRIVGPGQGQGGIMGQDPSQGVPPHWNSYIHTPNVDETTAKAAELGGTIAVPPSDIPGIGRFSVVIDPQGAGFSPYTTLIPDSVPSFGKQPPPGAVTWNELITDDVDASSSFYSQLFGYTADKQEMGGQPYTILNLGDEMAAGLLQKPADAPMPSAWITYYHVADLDKSLADVERLGGQNLSGVIEVPTVGRVAMVADSVGAVIGLHEPAPAA